MNTLTIISIVLAGVAVLSAELVKTKNGKKRKKKIKSERIKYDYPENARGLVLGLSKNKMAFSPSDGEGHIGVFGSSGTGKTSAICIPTLQHWDGTSYTIDVSDDILQNTPNLQNKLVIDPESDNSLAYDIFGMIHDLPEEDKNPALENLSMNLIEIDPKADANAQFYMKGGQRILTASLIAFYHEGLDFCDICKKVVSLSYKDLFAEIAETGNDAAYLYIASFEGELEQHISGCKSSAAEAVMLFASNRKVYRTIHRSTKTQSAIAAKDVEDSNIFLHIEDVKTPLYRPVMKIITAQIMEYISNRKVDKNSKSILLCLDEFASLKFEADVVLNALRKYRKRKCRVLLLTQDLSDLSAFYGRDYTNSMLANLHFKVLMGGLNEPDSRKYFADLIGYKETTKKSTTKGSNNSSSVTEVQTREYVIEPADLDRQGKDKLIVIIPDGEGYLILNKYFYYEHKEDENYVDIKLF